MTDQSKNPSMTFDHKSILTISFLIIALSVAYYFVIYLPKLEQDKITQTKELQEMQINSSEQQASQENTRRAAAKLALTNCLGTVEDTYSSNWASNCKTFGINNKGATCSLPENNAKSVEDMRKQGDDTCFKIFPQN